MARVKQTDNHAPGAKLALRRHFLAKYHAEGPRRVLDCCQGSGLLWGVLSKEFPLDSYWGLDLKPKKGRLKLDSVRVLAQSGWRENIIDIDTYGAPWKHWEALLLHVTQPITVFLTIGKLIGAGGFVATDKLTQFYLGLAGMSVPPTITCHLNRMALPYALGRAWALRSRIIEAVEAVSSAPHARYVGVRLEPAIMQPATSKDPSP